MRRNTLALVLREKTDGLYKDNKEAWPKTSAKLSLYVLD